MEQEKKRRRNRGHRSNRTNNQNFHNTSFSNLNQPRNGSGFQLANQSGSIHNQARLSLKKVVDLLEETPEKIILTIESPFFGFSNYLNAQTMGSEMIKQFSFLIEKILNCNSMPGKLNQIIHQFVESNFYKTHLYEAIYAKSRNNNYDLNLITSTLRICKISYEKNPFLNLGSVRDRLELLIRLKLNNKELLEEFENGLVKIEDELKEKVEQEKNYTFKNIDHKNVEPPNDFTQMNIEPKLEDIMTDQEPFLRVNISNGAYRDINHYLDVNFRLLREDYLRPLREGVSKFREIINRANIKENVSELDSIKGDVKKLLKNIEGLSIYFGVTVHSTKLTDLGIVYQIKMKQDQKRIIDWEFSKKLIFGSMVCFSCDNFMNNCLVGIVCDREMKDLKNNLIGIRFNYNSVYKSNNECFPNTQKVYTMLETSAFFESYRHVLDSLVSLRHLDDDTFPFKKHLVDCQNQIIERPAYLTNACLDMRTLVSNVESHSKGKLIEYSFSKESDYAKKCYLSNQAAWPTAKQMNLDDSQYGAIRLALENKLALIQGPPGTGKTFIGVKIVQLLMNNKHTWWNRPNERHKPILMICYTNHALDQFLEFCIQECKLSSGVVRVGGRSKSENLNSFLLSNIKRTVKSGRQTEASLYYRIKDQRNILGHIQRDLIFVDDLINRVSSGSIVPLEKIKQFIKKAHLDQLSNRFNELEKFKDRTTNDYSLLEWLGLINIEILEYELVQNFENLELNEVKQGVVSEDQEEFGVNASELNEEEQLILEEEERYYEDQNNERMLEEDFNKELFIIEKNNEKNQGWNPFKEFLMDHFEIAEMQINYNVIYNEGFDPRVYIGDNGWYTKNRRGKNKNNSQKENLQSNTLNKLNSLLKNANRQRQMHNIDDLENVSNIWRLDYTQRTLLYLSWLEKFKQEQIKEKETKIDKFNQNAQILQELKMQEDRSIMQDALIIAMTTTGSSRYHRILKDIGPRIVIVEEAAEVFEAHIVASLSKHTEHLILIGDHVQLRPNPTVYKLATKYNLDVSLFERLLNNKIKKVMLTCQHRMRPEISLLMRHFYDIPIQDDNSVKDPVKYASIRGLKKDIFFMSHNYPENGQIDTNSKINMFEVNYISKLCAYIIKQGFDESNITVLSMYLGQMMQLRSNLRKMNLGKVKISTVDNYQGEENEIIILSLVRSNPQNKIGFLSISNRVCVALSRARRALYCIGNMEFIGGINEKWYEIISTVKAQNSFGNSLTLTCGNHPKNDIEASEPHHFDLRPDGGCQLKCDFRLKCGHVCALYCHTVDQDHKKYICKKKCEKMMKCGHKCNQQCSHKGSCDTCLVKVDQKIVKCGHNILFKCDTVPQQTDCIEKCAKKLNCGHSCTKLCANLNCEPCETLMPVPLNCDHKTIAQITCSELSKIDSLTLSSVVYQNKCSKKCNALLKCEHKCKSNCGDCSGGYIHSKCRDECNRILFCDHKCTMPCSEQCKPCQKKCENSCSHSKCKLKCSVPCKPCKEECKIACLHKKCNKKCNEMCNVLQYDKNPCNEPCNKMIKKCGHPCIGICGEKCPRLCRICDKEKVTEILFGDEDEPDAKFVYLEDCKHIIELKAMDNWIKTTFDIDNSKEKSSIQLPKCPRCKTTIRHSIRYSNCIKRQLNLIEEIKAKLFGNEEENESFKCELLKEIKSLDQDDLSISQSFLKQIKDVIENYDLSYNEIAGLKNNLSLFHSLKKMSKDASKLISTQEKHVKFEIKKIFSYIYNEQQKYIFLNEYQLRDEIFMEVERIEYLLKYYQLVNKAKEVNSTTDIDVVIKIGKLLVKCEMYLISQIKQFNDSNKEIVDEAFKQLVKLVKVELTPSEKRMIVAAMGLQKGHWFKCPNGHVYCIGECGGAMQKSICPECKAAIGGTNHSLISNNQHAGDFDESSYAAWSDTANNMGNWDM